MKTTGMGLRGFIYAVLVMSCLMANLTAQESKPTNKIFSSLDPVGGPGDEVFPAATVKLENVPAVEMLALYQKLSGRTVIRSPNLPTHIVNLTNETPLTRTELLQLLDTVLAQQGIAMIIDGANYMKAVPFSQAPTEPSPIFTGPRESIPNSGTPITYYVTVKDRRARELAQALQSHAKMPNSILAIDDAELIVLRDYAANVRRMLDTLERIEKAPKKALPPKKEEAGPTQKH